MAANCETFIFAGFGWVMQGDAELATQDVSPAALATNAADLLRLQFDHALELYDELPDFDTAQPFPYPRQWLRMVHDLLDAKGNDGLDEAKAILRKDVTFISWDEPTVDSTTRDTKPALIIEPVPKPTVSSSRQVTPPPTAQSLAKEKKRKTKILGSVTKEVQSGGASKRMRTESNASTASTGATRPKRKL